MRPTTRADHCPSRTGRSPAHNCRSSGLLPSISPVVRIWPGPSRARRRPSPGPISTQPPLRLGNPSTVPPSGLDESGRRETKCNASPARSTGTASSRRSDVTDSFVTAGPPTHPIEPPPEKGGAKNHHITTTNCSGAARRTQNLRVISTPPTIDSYINRRAARNRQAGPRPASDTISVLVSALALPQLLRLTPCK